MKLEKVGRWSQSSLPKLIIAFRLAPTTKALNIIIVPQQRQKVHDSILWVLFWALGAQKQYF